MNSTAPSRGPNPAIDGDPSGSGLSIKLGRLTKGVLANSLGQAINAAGQLVLVPLFLTYWGRQRYGEWMTLSAVIAYLAIIDFGMQMFVVNRLNQCYVNQDVEEHTRVLHSALLVSVLFSVAALAVASLLLFFAPIGAWFHFRETDRSTVSLTAILLSFQIVGAIPHGLIAGIYRGIREYPRGQMIANLRSLGAFGFTAIAVVSGGGLASAAFAQLLALAVATLFIWKDLSVRHPEVQLGFRNADLRLAMSFLGPSSLFFLIQLSMALTIQGSTVMVSAIFGAMSVAVFVPLRTLSNLLRQLIGAFFSALWPDFTALEASGRYEALRRISLLVSKLLVTVSAGAAVFLHFAGAEIVTLWTYKRVVYDARLMDAFLILLLFQAPWLIASLVLASSNNHRRLSVISIVSASVGLALGYAGARLWGMAGLVYGIWIADVSISGTFIPMAACRLLRQPVSEWFWEVVARGAGVCCLIYFSGWMVFSAQALGTGILRLVLCALMIGLASLGLAYVLYANSSERSQIGRWFRRGQPEVEAAITAGTVG